MPPGRWKPALQPTTVDTQRPQFSLLILFYFTLFCFILDEVSYVAQAGIQLSHPAL